MKSIAIGRHSQQGAALVVGLIMLTLITVMVTSNFSLSASSLKAVGNAQFRGEALSAANGAIERVVSSPFTDAPAAEVIDVDLNVDGNIDYRVQLAAPQCIGASQVAGSALPPSSSSLGPAFSAATPTFETVWDLDATVTDANNSGATVQVHQGVRVLLTQAQYTSVCS
jgi:hypothetical protein